MDSHEASGDVAEGVGVADDEGGGLVGFDEGAGGGPVAGGGEVVVYLVGEKVVGGEWIAGDGAAEVLLMSEGDEVVDDAGARRIRGCDDAPRRWAGLPPRGSSARIGQRACHNPGRPATAPRPASMPVCRQRETGSVGPAPERVVARASTR